MQAPPALALFATSTSAQVHAQWRRGEERGAKSERRRARGKGPQSAQAGLTLWDAALASVTWDPAETIGTFIPSATFSVHVVVLVRETCWASCSRKQCTYRRSGGECLQLSWRNCIHPTYRATRRVSSGCYSSAVGCPPTYVKNLQLRAGTRNRFVA